MVGRMRGAHLIGAIFLLSSCFNAQVELEAGLEGSAVTADETRLAAPAGLSYASNPYVLTVGAAAPANAPQSTGGTISLYQISAALPAGLSFDSTTGGISGTPTTITASTVYTVTGSNSAGTTSVSLTITVNDQAPASLSYSPNNALYGVGIAIPPNSPTVTGGAVVTYSVAPALPAGLSMSAATGVISGTPLATLAAAVFTVTGTNTGGSISRNVTIEITESLVRKTDGTWVAILLVPCGDGTVGNCTATVARNSCTSIGRKVVSHASDGSASVISLGATASTWWSISYFKNGNPAAAGQCLVGISNLDWSNACGLAQWHGNTVAIPATVGEQFGYVNSGNSESGYDAGLTNTSGSTWGCYGLNTVPAAFGGCTTYYVACR